MTTHHLYTVSYQATIDIAVTISAADEDEARDRAGDRAEQYATTVHGDGQGIVAAVSLDGIGAYEVQELQP